MELQVLVNFLEKEFPLSLQEDYDNSGLQLGDKKSEIKGVLVSLDCTEQVVLEAIEKNCNVLICHHPLLFKGLKKITTATYVERTVRLCIQHDIAVYAVHTNLDNHPKGVNFEISKRIGLMNTKILAPKNAPLYKLSVYTPIAALEAVDAAIFEAGGGSIGEYSACHFRQEGIGTFKPSPIANPTIGEIEVRSEVEEYKVDYLVEAQHLDGVLNAMNSAHPYEVVAHDIILLQNQAENLGAGQIGELPSPCDEKEFLERIKEIFACKGIRYTKFLNKPIKKVAVCGGSGSFLTKAAIRQGADCYITSDIKYHEFFDAEEQLLLVDIGHYESEQYTSHRLMEILKEKFTNFAIRLSEINTNPINYL
jgi:dinuclear metal center YbgI/SA1388 family protein